VFRPKIIFVGALALLMIILVTQNSEVVTVTLLFWSFEMSRVILILLAMMTGLHLRVRGSPTHIGTLGLFVSEAPHAV
jgi:uncharacterized integral membrane protein